MLGTMGEIQVDLDPAPQGLPIYGELYWILSWGSSQILFQSPKK